MLPVTWQWLVCKWHHLSPTSLYNSIPLLTLKHPTTSILPPHHSTQKACVSFCFHCHDEASNSNFKIKCWALLFRGLCRLVGQLISCSSQRSVSWALRMELMSSGVLQRQNCRTTSFLWRFPSSPNSDISRTPALLPVLLLLSELAALYSNLNKQEQTGTTSGLFYILSHACNFGKNMACMRTSWNSVHRTKNE